MLQMFFTLFWERQTCTIFEKCCFFWRHWNKMFIYRTLWLTGWSSHCPSGERLHLPAVHLLHRPAAGGHLRGAGGVRLDLLLRGHHPSPRLRGLPGHGGGTDGRLVHRLGEEERGDAERDGRPQRGADQTPAQRPRGPGERGTQTFTPIHLLIFFLFLIYFKRHQPQKSLSNLSGVSEIYFFLKLQYDTYRPEAAKCFPKSCQSSWRAVCQLQAEITGICEAQALKMEKCDGSVRRVLMGTVSSMFSFAACFFLMHNNIVNVISPKSCSASLKAQVQRDLDICTRGHRHR